MTTSRAFWDAISAAKRRALAQPPDDTETECKP